MDTPGERRILGHGLGACDETPRDGRQRRTLRREDEARDDGHRDRQLAALASRQDGLVRRAQLVALGFSAREIDRRIERGSLIVLFRGIYAVGHRALGERAWMRAGLLAGGGDALLFHASAARLWTLSPRLERPLHVVIVGRRPRSRPGLRIHTLRSLDPLDRRIHDGLPVTSPARTLLDLAATEPPDVLARTLREARIRRGVRDADLEAAIARAPRRHAGIHPLRAATGVGEAAPTRSELERAMLRLIDEAGLPRPVVNHHDGREIVDFTWPAQRLVVEVDGWAAHGDRRAFEDDRARDAARQARGDVVLRFTWAQVTRERIRVAARVAQTLGVRS